MKIAIDIDDTLTDTKDNQIKLWKEYIHNNPNPNYTEELPNNINEFDAGEYINNFWDTYREELSFKSPYKKDVAAIINKLKDDRHELCIVTSRPDEKYVNLKNKIILSLKLNKINIDKVYTNVRIKGAYCKEHNFDLLIDDNLKQIENANTNGIKTILFNYNPQYKGLQTTSWKKIYNIIKELK